MVQRIGWFLVSNLAIVLVISLLLEVFNIEPYLAAQGLTFHWLLLLAASIGVSGSVISLLVSKWLAKRTYKMEMIVNPVGPTEKWLYLRVKVLSRRFKIGMPEIGIYYSREPNAFVTGWTRNHALLAVSTGLLKHTDEEELEGVIGHELAHIANGDMVTMTLLQGVVNTFVICIANLMALLVSQVFRRKGRRENPVTGFAYFGIVILLEIMFGVLATLVIMWFSRRREFKADYGSAKQMGSRRMLRALQKLQSLGEAPIDPRGKAFATMKISGHDRIISLFSSHPPLAKRIAVLQKSLEGPVSAVTS